MKKIVLRIMFLVGVCGLFYAIFVLYMPKQGSLSALANVTLVTENKPGHKRTEHTLWSIDNDLILVSATLATENKPGHINYVVFNRWDFQRVTFTTTFERVLNHVQIEGKSKSWVVSPGTITELIGGRLSQEEQDWSTWERRFALVRRELEIYPDE
jgi:hypothetical protein